MIRRPPRSTLDRSSAASDVYKRQGQRPDEHPGVADSGTSPTAGEAGHPKQRRLSFHPVSYTHLRAHETVLDLVCRLLLEKKKNTQPYSQ